MKTSIIYIILLASVVTFSSCRKDFTCTCTTTVGSVNTTKVHDLPNQYYNDARRACDRFESDANSNVIGTTNCHL